MKIVFLGTPEIARVCLEEILKSKHEVLAVVTNPDRPSGRGNKLLPSPVKTFAESKGLKVLQYEKISKQGVDDLRALTPNALVLVAFGQILSPEILDIALPINLHGSLLPKLRGPSPIQTAILNGETQTGVTIMKMAESVDSGDVLLQETVDIAPTDTSETLFAKMASVGAKTLVRALDILESGNAVWTPQNHQDATFCQMLTKENAKIDFACTTAQIVNKVRAYNPNPVAYFVLNGEKFKVFEARAINFDGQGKVGQVICANAKQGLIFKTADGFVEMEIITAPNSKKMQAKQYLAGKKINVGEIAE